MNKESFVFYESVAKQGDRLANKLGKEVAYDFYKAVIDFGLYGVLPDEDSNVWLYGFEQTITSISAAKDRYNAAVENGKKGGRPKVNLNEQAVLEKKKELGTWKETAQYFGVTEQSLKNYRNQWENQKNPKNPNNPNITIIENQKNPKNPNNPNSAEEENQKNPKNLNDNVNVNVNVNNNVNENKKEKEKDIFAFSWFDEEEEEERKKKIVESAKQVRLAAIRKNPDSRFRDKEEQEYFDFIKGANIEKGMSETAAEEDAWQMILDEREYNVSKIS